MVLTPGGYQKVNQLISKNPGFVVFYDLEPGYEAADDSVILGLFPSIGKI